MNTTLSGDRSDSHRAGHDRCYAHVADGVKVNFVTEKDKDGLMQPVLTDGLPTAASIMVSYLEINRTTRKEGEYKVVNSGAPGSYGQCHRQGAEQSERGALRCCLSKRTTLNG